MQAFLSGRANAVMEWLLWLAIAAAAYSQTGYFDEEIAQYKYGATGWPRAICAGLVIGATGQLLYRLFAAPSVEPPAPQEVAEAMQAAPAPRNRFWRGLQAAGVLALPMVYLYLMPDMGFYLLTPFFIFALLLLLEVRSPLALIGVTAAVYGLVLLIFTRLFFVALPEGYLDPYYDINIAIIDFARMGL